MARYDGVSPESVNSLYPVGEAYPSVLSRCNTRGTFGVGLASTSGSCLLAVCLHDVKLMNRQHLDTTALSYVNLERPNIAVAESRMRLRSGRLLGEYVNERKLLGTTFAASHTRGSPLATWPANPFKMLPAISWPTALGRWISTMVKSK